jgi:hypothetical protein
MDVLAPDYRLIIWTVVATAFFIFVGVKIYKFFSRKRT